MKTPRYGKKAKLFCDLISYKNLMNKFDTISNKIREVANSLFINNKGEVYVYGSQARHDANDFSDWDLLVIVEETLGKIDAFNKYGFPFCEMGWSYDADINPLVYTKEEWKSQCQTYFYHNVMQDAIKLYS